MSDNNEQIALLYVQKQEQFALEIIRKNVNLEVQHSLLINKYKELEKLYQDSQNSVSNQNEILNQAAETIKDLTEKNNKYEKLKTDYNIINNENVNLKNENYSLNNRINDLSKEIDRQNIEMKALFDENEDMKKIQPKKEKKKKVLLSECSVEEDNNTF